MPFFLCLFFFFPLDIRVVHAFKPSWFKRVMKIDTALNMLVLHNFKRQQQNMTVVMLTSRIFENSQSCMATKSITLYKKQSSPGFMTM